MTVLLLGRIDDPSVRMVARTLTEEGCDYAWPRQVADPQSGLVYPVVNHARKTVTSSSGEQIRFGEVTAVYSRMRSHFAVAGETVGFDVTGHRESLLHADRDLLRFLETTEAFVVNRPSTQQFSTSKIDQLAAIAAAGFFVPQSVLSSSLDAIRELAARVDGTLVLKSSSHVRSVAREVEDIEQLDAENLKTCPALFQERVLGQNVRVHVVGTQLSACALESSKLDYRYDHSVEKRLIDIDAANARKCVGLAGALGLELAGIDLIIASRGTYCLEVNPNPGHSYFDIDGSIAANLATSLSKA